MDFSLSPARDIYSEGLNDPEDGPVETQAFKLSTMSTGMNIITTITNI